MRLLAYARDRTGRRSLLDRRGGREAASAFADPDDPDGWEEVRPGVVWVCGAAGAPLLAPASAPALASVGDALAAALDAAVRRRVTLLRTGTAGVARVL